MDDWAFSPSYRRATLANWRKPPFNTWSLWHAREILPTAPIAVGYTKEPLVTELAPVFKLEFAFRGQNYPVADVVEKTDTDAMLILHNGKIISEYYRDGATAFDKHVLFSVSKSITAMLIGLLVQDGLINVSGQITDYVPELSRSGFSGATVQQALDMTVAIGFSEEYDIPGGDVEQYRQASGWDPAIAGTQLGLRHYLCSLPSNGGVHGQVFQYSSVCTDVLGWIAERASGQSLAELLSERIWQPLGAEQEAYMLQDPFGVPRTAGGICMTLRDMARVGRLMTQKGATPLTALAPFVADTFSHRDGIAWQAGNLAYFIGDGAYRNQWYLDNTRPSVAMAVGIHGQWIYVDKNHDLVIVKFSSQPDPVNPFVDALLIRCFDAISDSLK